MYRVFATHEGDDEGDDDPWGSIIDVLLGKR